MWDGHISASTHGVIAKILADMVETPPTAIILGRLRRRNEGPTARRRVLITGGAGFSDLTCATLPGERLQVVCVDNLLTGSTDNLAHIRSRDFTFIRMDVTGYIHIEGPIDYILHFASPASPKDYLELRSRR